MAASEFLAMASIYQRSNVWWIHYLIGGKSVSRSLRTTNAREARVIQKQIEGLEATHQLAAPSNTPIDQFLGSFCAYLKTTRTGKSAKNDISYLRSFFGSGYKALRPTGMNRQTEISGNEMVAVKHLEQISSKMVSTFIRRRMVDDAIAPKTANRTREVLHKMFSYAIEHHGYICPDRRYRNPVEAVKRTREQAPQIRWLTGDQIDHQLAVLADNPTLVAMVATYIYAGPRREEALWLTVDDIDLKRRLIRVQAKTVDGRFWQPKTKRNRVVPISSALLAVLSKYDPKRTGPWYFPSPKGMRWDPDNFSETLRKINRQHDLPWSCLDFRHTFGSHLAQKGESLYKIAELMGNSPEICRRHYTALLPEKMHDAVEFDTPATPGGQKAATY